METNWKANTETLFRRWMIHLTTNFSSRLLTAAFLGSQRFKRTITGLKRVLVVLGVDIVEQRQRRNHAKLAQSGAGRSA